MIPLLGVFQLFFQVFFAVHAIKTGRPYYWIFIIIFFPGIGSLIYFFAEFLSDIQGNRKIKNLKSGIENTVNSGKKLKLLEDQAEITPSFNNRKILAAEYVKTGNFDKAVSAYGKCLQDNHFKDESIVEGLALAYFMKKDLDNARKTLENLRQLRKGVIRGDEFDLLMAMTLEESGYTDEALVEYEKLSRHFSGDEARCRHAMLLKKTGEIEKADRIFNEILKSSGLAPGYYKKMQKKWINIASKERSKSFF